MRATFLLLARPKIIESFDTLTKIYQQNQNILENQSIFKRFMDIFEPFIHFVMIEYAIVTISAAISPGIYYLFNGTIEYMAPFFIPGLSIDSWQCVWHFVLQAYLVVNTGFFYGYFDLLFFIQVLHVVLMIQILGKKVRAISRQCGTKRRKRRVEAAMNLRNLIDLHNEVLG